jgi:hypothetical protein
MEIRFPAEPRDYSLLHIVQIGSGAHPAFYTMGKGAASPWAKRTKRQADHSPPSSAEVKNGEDILPLPAYLSGS